MTIGQLANVELVLEDIWSELRGFGTELGLWLQPRTGRILLTRMVRTTRCLLRCRFLPPPENLGTL
jgi:hypothetical protein